MTPQSLQRRMPQPVHDCGRGLFRYVRDENGVVAVEFALIAIPLFVMIMGIVELSLFFASGLVLEGASAEAGRLIRTGQVQSSGDPEGAFAEALCDNASAMLDCDRLQYEVIHIATDSFDDAADTPPNFDEDGNLQPRPFDAGNSNDIILIRTAYRHVFYTPFMGPMLTGDPSRNWSTHLATAVIKSEPYIFGED